MHLTLIGKPGCHLCDDARQVIEGVIRDLPDPEVVLDEQSILDDDRLRDEYWDQIPVVLIDGVMHTYWRVDPARLRAALTAR